MSTEYDIVLGSRSPRRLELLSLLVSPRRIRVVVPEDETEAGFGGKDALDLILPQLAKIARTKNEAVRSQIEDFSWNLILTADTVVIATDSTGARIVLEKPDGPRWEETTREWFERYYSNKTHQVATGVCLCRRDGTLQECQVLTEVSFGQATPEMIDWYIATREPLGKAGGYGLQGAADIFVKAVVGSPSNVIGLPLEQTWQALRRWGVL